VALVCCRGYGAARLACLVSANQERAVGVLLGLRVCARPSSRGVWLEAGTRTNFERTRIQNPRLGCVQPRASARPSARPHDCNSSSVVNARSSRAVRAAQRAGAAPPCLPVAAINCDHVWSRPRPRTAGNAPVAANCCTRMVASQGLSAWSSLAHLASMFISMGNRHQFRQLLLPS
jgi:hypothetical protein